MKTPKKSDIKYINTHVSIDTDKDIILQYNTKENYVSLNITLSELCKSIENYTDIEIVEEKFKSTFYAYTKAMLNYLYSVPYYKDVNNVPEQKQQQLDDNLHYYKLRLENDCMIFDMVTVEPTQFIIDIIFVLNRIVEIVIENLKEDD